MEAPLLIPPVIAPRRSISYELTRWDLFMNFTTIVLRNRILQIFVAGAFLLNAWLILSSQAEKLTLFEGIAKLVGFAIFYLTTFLFLQVVLALALAYGQKHRGVVGRHTLEITEQGLIESSEVNETLHKWAGILRVFSLLGYLYIYVGENNSHPIPKRAFPPGQLEDFEREVNERVQRARGR